MEAGLIFIMAMFLDISVFPGLGKVRTELTGEPTPIRDGEHKAFEVANLILSKIYSVHHPAWKNFQNSCGANCKISTDVTKSVNQLSSSTSWQLKNTPKEDSGGYAGNRAAGDKKSLSGVSVALGLKARGRRQLALATRRTRRIRRAAAMTHPPSPCPWVFSYLRQGPRGGKWYGTIMLTTRKTIRGVTLRIQLDKPAILLGAWLGEVQTQNKMDFIVSNKEKTVTFNSPISSKILVQFNEGDLQPPRIKKIWFNGMQICPASNDGKSTTPLTRSSQGINYEMAAGKPTTPPVRSNQGITDEMVDGVPCGRADPKPSFLIANAQETERGEWPWHAAIYDVSKRNLEYICGGSLIGKKMILTAAHCVSERKGAQDFAVAPEARLVSLGKFLLNIQEGDVQTRKVEKIYIHSEYSKSTSQADIAILVLTIPVEFTEFVKPVCLWNGNQPYLSEIEGKDGAVVGWGKDENGELSESLKMAKMPVVSQQTCIWSNPQFFSRYTSDRTFCAGYRNETSACNGDSGGGMFFPKTVPGKKDTYILPVTWTLRGIVSLSVLKEFERTCDTKQYVIFTDTAKFYHWIKEHQLK
ncbi:transmembrane protease serine 9-like isoform X2 [Ischnura elegans]|uniref:transmembrane protease serine 9-like isoform X2 n=1 Tax=Ischnura elegans TaxID=197161 RepID=UPI001ED86EE5|nr:transmembrane protease serine 9-like isoform X2 [Ischnura elegans]